MSQCAYVDILESYSDRYSQSDFLFALKRSFVRCCPNYNPEAAVIISTHLIADVEPVLDDVIFLDHGHVALHESCEEIRETRGQSVDALFREVFKCWEN